jgi:CRISPR-associated endoribonuclease Cas6
MIGAPASLVLDLRLADGAGGGLHTRHVHAWFFAALRKVDEACASALHEGGRHKPFTLWGGRELPGRGPLVEHPGREWLRITVLDHKLAPLVECMLRAAQTVRLGESTYHIAACAAVAAEHPWAGVSSYDVLWAGREPPDRVRLSFLTPTAFAGRPAPTLFPVPRLVFTYLARAWNAHSGRTIAPDILEELLDRLREVGHGIRTAGPVSFGRYFLNGFVGECDYEVGASAREEIRHTLGVLTRFAFFSGVGLKTTMGMGQVVGEPGPF